jgi:kojibiose phosphorylase
MRSPERKAWSIVETHFDPVTSRAYEGLFTQGGGCLHVRGSLEEHLFDAPQNLDYTRLPANVTSEKFQETKVKWGAYIPGLRGQHPLLNRGLVNLPFFLDLAPYVAGEKLDMEASQVSGYCRALELDIAVLRRSLIWHTKQGANLQASFERFVSAAQPGLVVQRLELISDREVQMEIRGGIDSDVRTSGYEMFVHRELDRPRENTVRCTVQTNTNDQATIASRLSLPGASWIYSSGERSARLQTAVPLPPGTPLVLEKRTVVTSSFDHSPQDPLLVLDRLETIPYPGLLEQHQQIWSGRWQRSDVIVEGDERSQLALRTSLYHLLRAHPDDDRLAIDPKGYAGDAYRGCYFWDTEIYMLPFFLYTDPQRARSLLGYRIHSLPGAQSNARHSGYAGARYAWEADVDGTETCPNWQYRDHEIHVTADVAYGLAHYARATGEETYLRGPAADIIREAARFWFDRLDWRKGEKHPSLLGVMGPDEYTPISNNNSYTNRLAAFALNLAAELGPHIGIPFREARRYAQAAAELPLPRSKDGQLILQCEDFERLAEPAFDRFWKDRSRPFASQAPQEWLYRSKCLKQADVLLLMMLFPGEFSVEEVRRAWDYYLPYTTHDSSLSAGVHAIIACRLGKLDEAWQFWQQSSLNDLDFSDGGAAEGVHMAGSGMNWQTAVFGFGGLATAMQVDRLTLRPRLPAAWSRLAFPLVWQGCPVDIDIRIDKIMVTNRGSKELAVTVDEQEAVVPEGMTGSFPGLLASS